MNVSYDLVHFMHDFGMLGVSYGNISRKSEL